MTSLFSIVKEERAATEGIENPAFNISSTDLSAYQPSEEEVIRHDKPDSTLAAHQQKLRLQAHAEPRGETSNQISLKRSDSGCILHPTCVFQGLRQAFPSWRVQTGAPANTGWETQNTAENISSLNIKRLGLCLHAPVTPCDGGHGDQALVAVIPHNFCQVWFQRHRSRSKLTDAARLLAVEHGGVLNSLQIWWLFVVLRSPVCPQSITILPLLCLSLFFFSHCCSDAWSREASLFDLSRGAILAFKLSFDAALKRVTASGSSLFII